MEVVLPKHQIECARVYVDPNKRIAFTLKCYYCCREFHHWTRFAQHIQLRHMDLKQSFDRAKDMWRARTDVEIKHELDAESAALHETEIVLITDEGDGAEVIIDSEEDQTDETETEEQHSIVDLQVDFIMPKDVERTKRNQSFEPEEVSDSYDGRDFVEIDELVESCQPKKTTKTLKLKVERDNDHERDEIESPKPSDKKRATGQVFYHLRETDPAIMYDFIDIIHRHSCHWDRNSPDYTIRDKRDESAEKICTEMKQLWNINITPRIARNSVLYMCRWFEREYLRSLNKKKLRRGIFRSSHPDYYNKLYAFLPHDYLQLLSCKECGRKFKSKSLLMAHKYTAHNGEVPYKCDQCGRGFVHISSYRGHLNRHNKEIAWPCNLCDYRAVTKTDFHMHMITHTDIRGYVCELCGAAYKSSTSLNVHKRSHGPPKLKCERCGKQFHENYRLKRHMWLHEEQDTKIGRGASTSTVKCEMCQRRFACQDTLRKHQIVHAGKLKKPKVLEEEDIDTDVDDDMKDIDVDDLYSEIQSEDGDEFGCTICGAEFISLIDLRAHLVKNHDTIII